MRLELRRGVACRFKRIAGCRLPVADSAVPSQPMEERKILIVEDEHKIADTLKTGLGENGYHVEVAYDGKIGERLFMAHDFNLVILDINLPGINGYDLCKIIRRRNPLIPIIMLTALGRLNDKIEGYDAGDRKSVV